METEFKKCGTCWGLGVYRIQISADGDTVEHHCDPCDGTGEVEVLEEGSDEV